MFRVWSARAKLHELRRKHEEHNEELFFHHCATVIQKYVRGWSSRLNLHDFYGRKCYLEQVKKRGEWTTEYLHREHASKVLSMKQEEESRVRQDFNNLVSELHHLSSTKAIPGVFSAPCCDSVPSMFGKTVEQHLHDNRKIKRPRSLHPPESLCSGNMQRSLTDGRDSSSNAVSPSFQPRSASVGRSQRIQGPSRYHEVNSSGTPHTVSTGRKKQKLPTIPFPCVSARTDRCQQLNELLETGIKLPKIRCAPPYFSAPLCKSNRDHSRPRSLTQVS